MDKTLLTDVNAVLGLLNFNKLALLLIGFACLWLLSSALKSTVNQLMERLPAYRISLLQMATLFSFVIYIVGAILLLVGVINPPKEVLLAVGGSMAVAFGFALKDVAASLVAGIMLLFEQPFRVGDRVTFHDTYGEIVSIGLRAVRVRTLDDNLVTIPNARFMTEVVASSNSGALDMMVVMDFHVGLQANLELARDLIHEVIVTSRFVYLKKPVSFTLSEVIVAERLALRIRAKAYVLDVRYEKAFQSDIVMRVSQLFVQRGIARPQIEASPSETQHGEPPMPAM